MSRGFTLLEVMIALAILGMGLAVLLQAQASSLSSAGRSRDLTVATLLARGKMIDIEKELFDEGFTQGEVVEEGDFGDEGHPEVKWKYEVTEVELDLSSLTSMCEGFGSEGGDASSCEQLAGGLGMPFDSLAESLGQSMRLVELTVTMPRGAYSETVSVRSIVTREDMGLAAPTAPVGTNSLNPTVQDNLRGTLPAK